MRVKSTIAGGLILALVWQAVPLTSFASVSCDDAASCAAALRALQSKFAQSQQKLSSTKQTAHGYASALQDLGDRIQVTSKKLATTQDQIDDADDRIHSLTDDIAHDEQHIKELQDQVHQEIVALYKLSQRSTIEILLSNSSFGEAMNDMNNVQAVQNAIQRRMQDVETAKADSEAKKSELEQKKQELGALHDDLSDSKKNLAYQKDQTNTLLNATEAQVSAYAKEQAAIKQQIAETQKRLQDLISQAHWGDDIVSAPAQGWTYNQLNYPQTLGNSRYTVHDYGCFVTSLAMVATQYGHAVTPAQIANHPAYFTRGGYLFLDALAGGIGLTVKDRGAVDWATVDDELAAGRPVIVSIYIPQVGAINTDGSSHFIVLQGKAGNTYLMQDPLGQNRSYALKYVRSMVLLRSN